MIFFEGVQSLPYGKPCNALALVELVFEFRKQFVIRGIDTIHLQKIR